MSFGVIYKATNKINGKIYIGQTTRSLRRRKQGHIQDTKNNRDNSIFHRAIKKYGKNVFSWEIIENCDSKDELDEMEFHYIKQYDSYDNGYNLTLGGEGSPGAIRSEDVRRKISNSTKGSKAYWYGKHHSVVTKKKLSEKLSGKNNPNFGKRTSDVVKKKISDSLMGHLFSLESIKKMSDSHKGKCIGSDSPSSKKFVITTPEGKEFIIDGLINFCRNYKKDKLNYKNLSQCATGEKSHHKHYRCRYYIDEKDSNINFYNMEIN